MNGKADALTRRSGDLPEEGDGRGCPIQALIPIDKFDKFALSALSTRYDQDILDALASDKLAQEVFQCLEKGTLRHPVVPLGECAISPEGLLVMVAIMHVIFRERDYDLAWRERYNRRGKIL